MRDDNMEAFTYPGAPPPPEQQRTRLGTDVEEMRSKEEFVESGRVAGGVNQVRLKHNNRTQDSPAIGLPPCENGNPLAEHAQHSNEYQLTYEKGLTFGETKEIEVAPLGCPRVDAYLSKEVSLMQFLEESDEDYIHPKRDFATVLKYAWRKLQDLAQRFDSNIRESFGYETRLSSPQPTVINAERSHTRPRMEESNLNTSSSPRSPTWLQRTAPQHAPETPSPRQKHLSLQSTPESKDQAASVDREDWSNESTPVDEPNERGSDRNASEGCMEQKELCSPMLPGEWFRGIKSTPRNFIESGDPSDTRRFIEESGKVGSMEDTSSEEDLEAYMETGHGNMLIDNGLQTPMPHLRTPQRDVLGSRRYDADTLGWLEGTKSPVLPGSPLDFKKLGEFLGMEEVELEGHALLGDTRDALAKLEGRPSSPLSESQCSLDYEKLGPSLGMKEHAPFEDAKDLAKLEGRPSPPSESRCSLDDEGKLRRSFSRGKNKSFEAENDSPSPQDTQCSLDYEKLRPSFGWGKDQSFEAENDSPSPQDTRCSLDYGKLRHSFGWARDESFEAENDSPSTPGPRVKPLVLGSAGPEESHQFGHQPSKAPASGSQAFRSDDDFPSATSGSQTFQADDNFPPAPNGSQAFEADNHLVTDPNPRELSLTLVLESGESKDLDQVARQVSEGRASGVRAFNAGIESSFAPPPDSKLRRLSLVSRSAGFEESHTMQRGSISVRGRFPVKSGGRGGWISQGTHSSVIPNIQQTIDDSAIPLQLTGDPIFSAPDGRYASRLPMVLQMTIAGFDQTPWPTPSPYTNNSPYLASNQPSQECAGLYRGRYNNEASGFSSNSSSGLYARAARIGTRGGDRAVNDSPSQCALDRRLQKEQQKVGRGVELPESVWKRAQENLIHKRSAEFFAFEPRSDPAGQGRTGLEQSPRRRKARILNRSCGTDEDLADDGFKIASSAMEYRGGSYVEIGYGSKQKTQTSPDLVRHRQITPSTPARCLETEANGVVSASSPSSFASSASAWGTGGHQPQLQVPQKVHLAPTPRAGEIPFGVTIRLHQPRLQVPQKAHIARASRIREIPVEVQVTLQVQQQSSPKWKGLPRTPYLAPIILTEYSAQRNQAHVLYEPLNSDEHTRLRKHQQQHQEKLVPQAAFCAKSKTERPFLGTFLDSSRLSMSGVETQAKNKSRVTFGTLPRQPPTMDGRLRVTQSETILAKAKAMEDARQMQAQVNEMCLKERREPPPWALIELIGKGSFGRVYKGFVQLPRPEGDDFANYYAKLISSKNMSTAQVVAVKTIDMDAADLENPRQADSYADFLNEVEALKALGGINAKNVNHVIAAEPVGTTLWLVTEHCAGGSLATLMKPTNPRGLQEKWVIPIVREVAVGIKWCHQAGIIHRDIKCANVLIAEDGGVQICDFGVAGIVQGRFDKRTTIIGTPHWMAPELFKNSANYGKEVDIWAFGAMIFELATGSPPHVKQGLLSFDDIGQWLKRNVPRLEGEGYSKGLRDLVACLLEELPEERPMIEQVQMHPYIANTESAYPTSSLTNLVAAFQQWMDHGGSRKSLFMPGGAQRQETDSIPNAPELIDEWNFSTTQAFSNRVSQHINLQDVIDAYGENIIDFDTAKPSQPSRRRPPPQALVALKNPLVKVFDPDTITNYKAHSEDYYGVRPQQYQSENLPTSDLPLRDDSVRVHIQGTMIDLGGHDMDTGLSSFPDMGTMRASGRGNVQEEAYSANSDFHRPALSDPADINPNRRTQDWKFPSFAPPASADPESSRFPPSSYVLPRPTITPGAGGRPALVHHPTEPLGVAFGAGQVTAVPPLNDRRSMVDSLIDLDMGLADPQPEIIRPSTANSEAGSATSEQMTSGNPFEFERHVSYQAPVENFHNHEPSVYFDDPRIDLDAGSLRDPRESRIDLDAAMTPPRDLQDVRDIADISDFSEAEQGGPDPNEASRYDPAGYSDTELVSMLPLPRPSNLNGTYTMAHFPGLPEPPSAAALAGTADRHEMTEEIHRALGSLTGQLEAFRDVYESPALTRSANRGIRR